MNQYLTLTASDGFELGAYRSDPPMKPIGGVVVIQEIFGVNSHIRNVTHRFALKGYVAIAPALFDRQQEDFQLGYSKEEIANARTYAAKADWDAMLRDTKAAIEELKSAGPVAVVGFCMGGSLAFLSATRLSGIKAAVGYYGGAIAKHADEKPAVPVQLHFGEKDHAIPLSDVEIIKDKRPEIEVHVYPNAQHGFNCDERASYDKDSAEAAWSRTQSFLRDHLR